MKLKQLKIEFALIIIVFFFIVFVVYFKHNFFIMQKQYQKLKLMKEKKQTEKHQLEVALRLKIEEFFEKNQ